MSDSKPAAPTTPLTDQRTPKSKGQKSSKERGSATNNKKSPGKRPKQGGS